MKKEVIHDDYQTETLGTQYKDVRKIRNSLDTMVVDSDRIDALAGALDKSLGIIENLALYGAASGANLKAVLKRLNALAGEGESPFGDMLRQEFGGLAMLNDQVVERCFVDESQFCKAMERKTRHDILVKAGINPNDKEKSMAYLIKLGQVITPPGKPQN